MNFEFDPKSFNQYMLAKEAFAKIVQSAQFGEAVVLTCPECKALFEQGVIDAEKNMGMVA